MSEEQNIQPHENDNLQQSASKPLLTPGDKKWKDYLFEFLMLFLAISAGFFAENMREDFANRNQEKTYMQMLINDLTDDIYRLDSNSKFRDTREKRLDSLISLLGEENNKNHTSQLYRLALSTDGYETFFRNDRTILQFKNAGGMTMIRNDSVSSAIMDYDSYIISEIDWNNNIEDKRINYFKEIRYQLFHAQVMNRLSRHDSTISNTPLLLLPASSTTINTISGAVFQMIRISKTNRGCAVTARAKAINLRELIKRQYHF